MADEVMIKNPTYFGIVCPKCGSDDWRVVRTKGSLEAAALNTVDEYMITPLKARCRACHRAFKVVPVEADESEVLSQPATLVAHRVSRITGIVVPNYILVNGVISDSIANGEEIQIELRTKHVYIQMFDASMTGSATFERFEVQPGETVKRDMRIKARWRSF
ncbi:hypothetical protein [Lacticaseibacillus brantae]|uniref:Uncharacterized protein n=1 Tax=Lacticaseibacillus brantae DSM 23927 TaxID=1423727 RepID=A0A0R2AWM5_9LACO|nr:hypothetical protein [Lacticaseibacillus brantae]KRM71800.1 hypothetical protein FC34_GL001461 [Lacticaseibacillus brantae DSM 23927]